MNKITIKKTRKYGNGVFADNNIKKGEVIHLLKGNKFDVKEFLKKIDSGIEYIDDPFQIGLRTYIDLDEISRTFNHSCDPNGGIRKNSELFAIRDIKKGEQITYDYSLTIAPTKWKMKCKCGSDKCRKTIGDVSSISKKRRDEYIKIGAVQRYMKKIITDIDRGKYVMPLYEKKLLQGLGGRAYNI